MSKQAAVKSRELRRARVALAKERGAKRNWSLIAGGVVIAGLVIAIVVSLVNAAGNRDVAPTGKLVTPAGATAAGALTAGNPAAPVKLELYLDYMCPYCGRFERANGSEIERLAADDTVRVELYPMSFLDKTSQGSRYSSRAANAAATVADRAPDKLLAFNTALFGHQPEEGTRGLTDQQIATLARDAGVPQNVVDRFADRTFEPWVAASTTAVFKTGITGTPTVKINGVVFKGDLYTTGALTQAIAEAKGR